jgi:hypothetical protein
MNDRPIFNTGLMPAATVFLSSIILLLDALTI